MSRDLYLTLYNNIANYQETTLEDAQDWIIPQLTDTIKYTWESTYGYQLWHEALYPLEYQALLKHKYNLWKALLLNRPGHVRLSHSLSYLIGNSTSITDITLLEWLFQTFPNKVAVDDENEWGFTPMINALDLNSVSMQNCDSCSGLEVQHVSSNVGGGLNFGKPDIAFPIAGKMKAVSLHPNALKYKLLPQPAPNFKKAVVLLLLQHGANVNYVCKTGWTPLKNAATKGDMWSLNLLLERGAVVNRQTGTSHSTEIMAAAQEGRCQILDRLLDHYINVQGGRYQDILDACNSVDGKNAYQLAKSKDVKKVFRKYK